MRIAFDAKRIFHNFTGLGNYSRTLVRELVERTPETSALLCTPSAPKRKETAYFLEDPAYQLVMPRAWQQLSWRQWGVLFDLRRYKPQLYHGLSNELPRGNGRLPGLSGRLPMVVTIHDLIFKRYPRQYKLLDRAIYDRKFRHACHTADRIIAISEATKTDIVYYYDTDPDRIDVIYQACDERFLVSQDELRLAELRDQLRLPETYSLYVGSLIERKNLLGLVEALALLPTELRHPLVVVGRGDAYKREVQARATELGVDKWLLFRQVDNEQLPGLYQAARCFLYPSLAEGFGIPVIEALNSGTPVVTSNRSSLPEAAGPHSLLVDPDSPAAIAEAWACLLEDDQLHARIAQAGLKYAERFRAEQVVPQMMELYRKVSK